ncbi:hypothetical protein QBC38DRAFT_430041 [Podospora fimiseda]|uniref:F-box domain-containing protein n=1 Tax=Podospora fimiseda TaxID=252190 RepID=A0AAN6YN68_9PEZI|nr:hypothetical protein QBC38DRAFT_430041 [Podospora fimiseda]
MSPSPCLFLNLPVDVILLFCKYLPKSSDVVLSLTCKDLYALIYPNVKLLRLGNYLKCPERQAFLVLLEKDLGCDWYYCPTCSVLHRFAPFEDPTLYDHRHLLKPNDCRRDALSFRGARFTIGYHHVRLAMNRHFLGPQKGLFQFPEKSPGPLGWTEKWSARIIQDELFLSCTRRSLRCSYDQLLDLFMSFMSSWNAVCLHVDLTERTGIKNSLNTPGGPFALRKDVLGWCSACVTDYETALEKHSTPIPVVDDGLTVGWIKSESFQMTVVSYHRLGDGCCSDSELWHQFKNLNYYGVTNPPVSIFERDPS